VLTDAAALLIDFGGVLTIAIRDAHRAWCLSRGLRPTAVEDVLRAWRSDPPPRGNPVPRVESGDLDAEEFERQLADMLRVHTGRHVAPRGLLASMLRAFTPDTAMIAMVGRIRACGVPVVLVTNSWGGGRPWESFGVLDHCVVSCEVGSRKPDPDIYRIAVDLAGVAPRQCVFVDDLTANVDAAIAYGLAGIVHAGPRATIEELRRRFFGTGGQCDEDGGTAGSSIKE